MSSRWSMIVRTTPSGKTLFVCRSCGRMSPTPDKECGSPTPVTWGSEHSSYACSDYALTSKEYGMERLYNSTVSWDALDRILEQLPLEATAEGKAVTTLRGLAVVTLICQPTRFNPGPWVLLASPLRLPLQRVTLKLIKDVVQSIIYSIEWEPGSRESIAAAAGEFVRKEDTPLSPLGTDFDEVPVHSWVWEIV